MSRKTLDRAILTVEAFQTAMDAAKKDVCCQIAEMMDDDANDVVESVKSKWSDVSTLEEAVNEGVVNGLGNVRPEGKVILFLKKESNKAVQDWKVRPFHLFEISLIMPEEGGFPDEVVAKFQLIGCYLNSNGDHTTMGYVHVNCCLIERYKGKHPEFMLEAEYGLYLDQKRAAEAEPSWDDVNQRSFGY